jgi:chlorobactene glucosyltransferase
MDLLFLCVPWIAVWLFWVLFVRIPKELPASPGGGREGALGEDADIRQVSVIVPARNEERNIGACLSSILASDYPSFEVIVVNDQSQDRTAEIVRGLGRGNAREVCLIEGEPLPAGWFGKPWACSQGAAQASGDLLLFIDADTIHAPDLLGRSVLELDDSGGDVLTIIGQQIMGTFWERLLQPQFFFLLAMRFPGVGEEKKPPQWRHAIANGQYLLFKREVYDALGGHEAVAEEVVEDLRLAQLLVHGGWKLVVRSGRGLKTRMYRSIGDLIEGWSKNVATAVLQTTPGWLLPVILPLSLLTGVGLWQVPPAVLAWALATGSTGLPLQWGAITTGFGVLVWGRTTRLMGESPVYGLLYPLGSILGAYIFVLSWMRGNRIRWKGRSYRIPKAVRVGWPGEGGSSPSNKAFPPRGEEG